MKKILYIFILTLVFISSCKSKPLDERFATLKVGLSEKEVIKIMGTVNERDDSSYYHILYWFENAKDATDATKKANAGIKVKYYCAILLTDDYENFKIKSSEDLVEGYWLEGEA